MPRRARREAKEPFPPRPNALREAGRLETKGDRTDVKIYKPRKNKKKIGPFTILFALFILALPLGAAVAVSYYFIQDMDDPIATLTPDREAVSLKKEFTLTAEDQKSGIREIQVAVSQGLKKYVILDKSYEEHPARVQERFTLDKAELRGGDFEMTATVHDGSFFNFGSGNIVKIHRKMLLDASFPNIKALTAAHYVRQGGVGLVIYSVTKEPERSGVMVGEDFYPGFRQESGNYLCLFAFPPDMTAEDFKPRLYVEDKAGNERQGFFTNMAIRRRFREEQVQVTDAFLQEKILPLAASFPGVKDPVELFKRVNSRMREQNKEMLLDIGKKTAPVPLWNGPFIYLPGSAVKGSFGAVRAYVYKGETIGEQTHMGIDLATRPKDDVPAANDGRVVFAGPLGIYGQTIIVDHGIGLQSLYGHLSAMEVKPGDAVKKGQPVGKTGSTGMAFGDHLHFGMLVSGREVIPIEWWDANWVNDNITSKMKRHGELGTPEEQPAAQ